jgi:Lipoprotein LpqB beta-propeller domain/Sporulation and spore germination
VTRRRLVYAVLAAALLAPLLTGCGVPSSSRPVVVGAAAPNGSFSEQVPITKQGPDRTIDAQELVRRYLRAVAGGNETTVDQDATNKEATFAKNFLTEEAGRTWHSGSDIIVVHARLNLPVTTASGIGVEVAMQPVGVLDNRGVIVPRSVQIPPTYQFTVVPAPDGSGLRIKNPLDGMLLSDDALTSLYEPWPIYFWDDNNNRTLVPDLRYISRAQNPANRDNELAGWLRGGPSDYVNQAVDPVPPEIVLNDRLVRDGNRLRINLSRNAANPQVQLPKYVVQLRWTLRWFPPGVVDLQIEGQHQNLTTGDMFGSNLAAPQNGQGDPPRFCVVDGRVRPLGSDSTALSVLSNDANAGVVSAAILHGSAQQIALVRQDSPGKVRLWLGAEQQDTVRYQQTDLVASSTSRPAGIVSVTGSVAQVLIAADGRLYDVSFDGTNARRKLDVTPPGIEAVTDVSVAPDGHRIALVAGGVPYVGALQTPDGSAVSVAQLRKLPAGLVDVTTVAWSREEYVVVAGRSGGQSALVEATFDGALITPLQLRNLPGPTVTRVVAHPVVRPSDPPEGQRGLMMLEANGHSYNVYSESVVDLATDPAFASPSPAPGKEPPPATAPFFLD